MTKNIIFFFKLISLSLLIISNLYAEDLSIIPQKKPILDKITKEKKITQGIIRPKAKPNNKVKNENSYVEILKPKNKPLEKTNENQTIKSEKKPLITEKATTEIVTNKKVKVDFLIPKSKPLLVKKTNTTTKVKSKYYKKLVIVIPKSVPLECIVHIIPYIY